MSLEFNADKEIIKSDKLKVKNETSVRFDLGGGADEKVALFGNLTPDVDKLGLTIVSISKFAIRAVSEIIDVVVLICPSTSNSY